MSQTVLVTGGAGYVGSALVPLLLEASYRARVLDLYIYGKEPLQAVRGHRCLEEFQGDIRDPDILKQALKGVDTVIHLACISNDPSYELNPALGRSINYDSFLPFLKLCKEKGVSRFVFASSSSVYGIKREPEVTENLSVEPLTDYSRYKAACEQILLQEAGPSLETVILRPATVCGYSPRLRLDLTVNILTHHALQRGEIKVLGGTQKRPNIHIQDMAEIYLASLRWPAEKTRGQVFNAGYENHTVSEIAKLVREEIGTKVRITTVPTEDSRSYHISSRKLESVLGFRPKRGIPDAVRDLRAAFESGKVPRPDEDTRYFNIKRMRELDLK